MNNLKFFVAGCLLVANSAVALQVKSFDEGVPLDFDISQAELTHIVVEDDRITGIKAALDNLAIEKDEEQGHLFIRPLGKPELVQIFVTTEQGRTIGLRLIPQDIPAESIRIKTDAEPITLACTSESSQTQIIELIKSLYHQTALEGYTRLDISENFHLPHSKLVATTLTAFVGQDWRGVEYSLQNTTNRTVNLLETDFYEPGVRAVAIADKVLAPHKTTKIYVIEAL